MKYTNLFFWIFFLGIATSCQNDPEFEITQNILFLVGDEGEGKTWKLVRAEIPLEIAGNPETVIVDILNQEEFACYNDDQFTFSLQDSLHIDSGNVICDDLFYENAGANWQINESSSDEPSILVISRSKENVTVDYELPLNQINREMIISQLQVPVAQPIEIDLNDIKATVFELDLTLFFESVNEAGSGK